MREKSNKNFEISEFIAEFFLSFDREAKEERNSD